MVNAVAFMLVDGFFILMLLFAFAYATSDAD
jgi:hypothetical protein